MRAMNQIRGYFSEGIPEALRLPVDGTRPYYYEKGSYVYIAIIGMALVNSAYVGFGIFQVSPSWPPIAWFSAIPGVAWFLVHMFYYRNQAHKRETQDSKDGLQFGPLTQTAKRRHKK
jgi:hypothetical protein